MLRPYFVLLLTIVVGLGTALAQNTDQEIPQPRSVRAVNGVLVDTLNLVMTTIDIQGRKVQARTYNGTTPGDLWRVKPGETMKIHLNNQLPPNPDQDLPDQGNYPQRPNTTNLHVHGLNVSPKGNGDNVLLAILPGEKFDYEFALPQNHAAGSYWYHPHHHTSTLSQVVNGLAGSIVVEDPTDPSITDPALLAMQDRVFLFSSFMVDTVANKIPDPQRLTSNTALQPLVGVDSPVFVNGVLGGTITMRPGEIQRWRMINATYELTMRMHWKKIVGTDTIDVEHLNIARDGLYYAQPAAVTWVPFTAGSRSDVLVSAPMDDATYVVIIKTLDRNMKEIESRVMATIVRAGDPIVPAMSMPAKLPIAIKEGSIRNEEITGTREVVFRIGDFGPVATDSTAISRVFTINNSPFNHDVVNITVKAGDVEEWTIRNESNGWHPFHIHINEFQVVAINGKYMEQPVWHDVLLLQPQTTYTIRHRFDKFDGKTVMHCHFLPHEDWGMMNLIEILPGTSSVDEEPWKNPMAFPNPVAGRMQQLSVRLPELLGDAPVTVSLHDVSGAQLQVLTTTASATPTVRFNVEGYAAGSYFVRVDDGHRYKVSDMVVLVR
jgi:FtsP/CotA-like multicopper oxidase with cupredoxin domain